MNIKKNRKKIKKILISSYKPFSKKLHSESDTLAKIIAVDFMSSKKGYVLQTPLSEQKEAYKKYDFIITKPTKVEVEQKKVWTVSKAWQGWSSIDIPKRKNQSEAEIFIMVNQPGDTLALIDMDTILCSRTYLKDTIYTKKEEFYAVPIVFCNFFYNDPKEGWVEISSKGNII